MNRTYTLYIVSEALKVAVEALVKYSNKTHGDHRGTYSASYFDGGSTAEEALSKIHSLMERVNRGPNGDEGNLQ